MIRGAQLALPKGDSIVNYSNTVLLNKWYQRYSSRSVRLAILFNIIYFIAISDITSVNIAGGNIRLAWLFMPFIALLAPKGKHYRFTAIAVFALFAIHIIASLIAGTIARGFIYSFWILFNYFFFFRTAYLITTNLGSRIWNAVLWGGRIQSVLAIIMTLTGLHERARFIYFEPSYLAIGLVPYLFTSIFWSKNRIFDFSLILFVLIFNQSANMMIAIIVAFIFWLFVSRRLWTSVCLVFLATLTGFFTYRVALNDLLNPNHALAKLVSDTEISMDLITAILSRAGNRIPRMEAALELLSGHWLQGYGPGAYIDITANRNFDRITGGLDYLDPAGLPVINVLLEAAANAGVLAAAVLVAAFVHVIRVVITRPKDVRERHLMIGAMLAYGVMLQFESSYLRAYVWLTFGVFMGCALRPRDPGATYPVKGERPGKHGLRKTVGLVAAVAGKGRRLS